MRNLKSSAEPSLMVWLFVVARFIFSVSLSSCYSPSNVRLFIMLKRMTYVWQDLEVCYAFVEFEDMLGVRNAVKVKTKIEFVFNFIFSIFWPFLYVLVQWYGFLFSSIFCSVSTEFCNKFIGLIVISACSIYYRPLIYVFFFVSPFNSRRYSLILKQLKSSLFFIPPGSHLPGCRTTGLH